MTRTKAQDRAIDRLAKRHGGCITLRNEPGGKLRVKLLGRSVPDDERERIITPSGLVTEPVA